jgi:uncharacterized protein (DUF58 family)
MRELEIISSKRIRAGFAGEYHSAFHGRGIEFSQVREYQPGDDVRTIDWNVTARSGTTHVKEFVEERDLTVVVAVDVSGSMSFGSIDWRKCDLATELAALFAYSAEQNADRVGLLLFSESVRGYIPPRRGHAHAQVVVRAAIAGAQKCSGQADLELASRFLDRVNRRRSVLILLSDFLDPHFRPTLRRLGSRHDVIAIRISDPRETRAVAPAMASIVDAESGASRLVDLRRGGPGPKGRSPAPAGDPVSRELGRSGVDMLDVSTGAPYDRDLLRFFGRRGVRR